MRYRAWHNRVTAYHERCLPAAERHEVEGHLRQCAACRRLLAEMQETDGLLRGSRPVVQSLSPAAANALLTAALAQSGARRPLWRWWGFGSFAVSMGGVLLAVTAGIRPPAAAPSPPLARMEAGVLARAAPVPRLSGSTVPATVATARAVAAPRPRRLRHRPRRMQSPVVRLASAKKRAVERPVVQPAAVPTPRAEITPAPALLAQGELLLVINEAPRLEIEVTELPAEAPGEACASSAVQDARGRVTQKEVRVSGADPDPHVVLIGDSRAPGPVNGGE